MSSKKGPNNVKISRLRRRAAILAVIAGIGILPAARGSAGNEGSTLVVAFAAEPGTLDWQMHGDPGAELALWSINESLVEIGRDGELYPSLAAELPVVDENDPTRWHIRLREGISFTNGEPFDAEAVKANVDRVTDPDFDTPTSGYELLAGAEVVSEYEVDILTKGPDSIFLYRLPELRMLPPEAMNEPDYAENPVGTGPYVFEQWDRGSRIVLGRNQDYWGEGGTVETVEIRFIDDENTRVAALSTGEVDLTPIAPDQAEMVPQAIRPELESESGAIRINITQPPYDDVRFRQALNYAIDKEAINDAIYGGLFEVSACQSVPARAFGFNPDLEAYPYDPDKARELLSEVDLPDGFSIDFEGTAENWVRSREVQEAIASYWRDLGLDVDLTINTGDVYLDKLLERDLTVAPGIVYMELDHRYFHGGRVVDRILNRNGAIASIGDQFPEVDPLLEQIGSFDEATSLDAFHQLFALACDQALEVFTLDRFDITGAADGVTYEPNRNFQRLDFNRVTLG